ncbi:hypothetical protein GQ44DRAFT_829118 [Phaeosphaeriaceae sp. PMI808]|nr:hypothetical protein GQ44DRAFT_829118 [Phaeosphaeriaceae sp. PMI808]
MEKCWFVLKQSHYPPPKLPESGIGIGNGAICLGHVIADATSLDGVINRNEDGIKFTPAVEVYHSESWDLDWNREQGRQLGGSTTAGAPLGSAVPVTVEHQTKIAFERTETDHKMFNKLDRYIIQVNRKFIDGLLEDEDVTAHIERTKGIEVLGLGGGWCVYIITGITVARGAKGRYEDSRKAEMNTSTNLNVADAASAGLSTNISDNKSTSMSSQKSSDFVWAVRLTKVWKGPASKNWDFKTVSKGATFAMGDERPWRDEIQDTLSQELAGAKYESLDLPDEESVIVF